MHSSQPRSHRELVDSRVPGFGMVGELYGRDDVLENRKPKQSCHRRIATKRGRRGSELTTLLRCAAKQCCHFA